MSYNVALICLGASTLLGLPGGLLIGRNGKTARRVGLVLLVVAIVISASTITANLWR